ncbi:1971_t:CDS:2, partial [Cetraspora pellucida]
MSNLSITVHNTNEETKSCTCYNKTKLVAKFEKTSGKKTKIFIRCNSCAQTERQKKKAKKHRLKSSNNKTIKFISSKNTESTSSPPQTIENILSLLLKTTNITYLLLDDEISFNVDDNESDGSEFIYDMHNLEEAVFSKFRNEEIDDLVKFSITIKIEEDLVNEENLFLKLDQQIKDKFHTIIKVFLIPLQKGSG